jgi:hypothetical protein
MRRLADRIQARAIRRCGELLQQIRPSKGGRPAENSGRPRPRPSGWVQGSGGPDVSLSGWVPQSRKQAADVVGMSEHQRKTAIRLSRIPDPEFEEAIEADEPPTHVGIAANLDPAIRRPRPEPSGSPATALAMAGYLSVQMLPRRVRICTRPASSRACIRYPSSLISCSQSEPSGACLTRAASCGFTQVGRGIR